MTKPITFDAPDGTREFLKCIDCKLQRRWPGLTAVRIRLVQATLISLLIGALAYSLDGNASFAIGTIAVVNIVLLADVIAVTSVEVSSTGIKVTLRDDE